ncbi:MAG: glucose-phosphate cytidylyltransferase [Frankiaceae bacterium]|jgi:glucose-1-phosphate cytidylyltransferase|nr:glucose-phosphate cytidylyltransferase [Frankiaceae bacterium]
MKAVILAGGLGSRLAEETSVRPKPMVEIGGKPLLWHLLKILGTQGIDDFVICTGYKGYLIKEYFANYLFHTADFTVDLKNGRVEMHDGHVDPWRVSIIDTGEQTNTGGRIRRIRHLLDDSDEPFLLTYGDGLADVDLGALRRFHDAHGRRATVTAVQPPGRFGALSLDGDAVTRFTEKPQGDGAWISGGFFLLDPSVVDLIEDDDTSWESGPLEQLAAAGQLAAYRHDGYFQPCDTLRDKHVLERLWDTGKAPWRNW